MSAFLSGSSAEECATKFNKFVYASADQSTKTELTAMQVERSCEDCYKAEYMNAHIGEEFQGTVVSAVEFGLLSHFLTPARDFFTRTICLTASMSATIW